MIGGFLGAGKSTAILRLAHYLNEKGLRVGLITNDQGAGLVDTAMLHSHGFPVEEIAGGCFCCRFNSLVEAASRLSKESRPDVFIAEPVGSCTDLVASVSYPLSRIYGDNFTIAPLSVLVDPARAMRILGLESGRAFSSKVTYIYRKQLEEADLIVINKCDLLEKPGLESLRQALGSNFPGAEVLACSARCGTGLDVWFQRIATCELGGNHRMELDYEVYAEGEALLGWLNCTAEISATEAFEGDILLTALAAHIQGQLNSKEIEIAHLKMTLSPHDESGELAVINLVRNDYVPELSQSLSDPLQSGQLILNLRAEASPEELRTAVIAALHHCSEIAHLTLTIEHLEHFRPAKPTPTHRMTRIGTA
ncbi:MAG: cobalamin biosynthesis protein P47K [Acidobacteria bacterium]|nr:MAG: cobalamin biosynthesis protein P47K [Acidobacteriota bacterium]